MKKLGATNVRLLDVANRLDHEECAIFTFAYAKMYFDTFLNGKRHGSRGRIGKRLILSVVKLFFKPQVSAR
jgi:hypothetical protein